MSSSNRLRYALASEATHQAEDKKQVEKYINVPTDVFLDCIKDMPKHHQDICIRRGRIRTYYKPFFTANPNGMGKTYNMGIVHICEVKND